MNYKPGLPNDCVVKNTDFIADRVANNFCEEFKILRKSPEKGVDPKNIAKRLFGENVDEKKSTDPKTHFNNLFNP